MGVASGDAWPVPGVADPAGQLTFAHASGPGLAVDPLEARYRPPELPAGSVYRTELLSQLERTSGQPLVLVSAPAGYGKTTLLAQWSMQSGDQVAWLTLDRRDSNPAVLADSVLTALEWVEINPVRPAHDFTLVFDNAHLVPGGVFGGAVLDVLGWLPPKSRIVVASRCGPELPLGRMRAHRMLFELGAEDLSMSPVEAVSLLREAGIDLHFRAVQDLAARTEGWPAALALAVDMLRAGDDPAETVANLGGDDHRFSEYFREELLATLSPATVRFLTHSSVLDRLSGPSCDAVLERTRSVSTLNRLAQDNVPIRPMDPSHEWYRLHGLFREMLQTELRRSEPELHRVLHRRAGDWHSRAGDLDRAIDHTHRAGDHRRMADLLWPSLPDYLGQGRNRIVQRWLGGITAEDAVGCSPLSLVAAHSQLAQGNISIAEQWARSASVAIAADTTDKSEAQRAAVLIIHAWAARSGALQIGQDAARAYELLPEDSPWRASCSFLQGTAALLTCHDGEAERQLEEGAARAAAVSPDIASLCLAQLAVLALDRDDVEAAGEFVSRARHEIDRDDLSTHPISALTFAVSAAVRVSQGRIDEAKTSAAGCVSLIGQLDEFAPWYCAETWILLARASLGLGNVPDAREQLAAASRLGRRTRDVVIFDRWFDEAWEQFDRRAEIALLEVGALTTAELRVLRFLPTHFSFHEIADRLHVSSNTVKTHVHAVYRKLDASSRSQAVANAHRAGLLGC